MTVKRQLPWMEANYKPNDAVKLDVNGAEPSEQWLVTLDLILEKLI